MNSSDVITTNQLALGFDKQAIVANINIQIHAGEFIGILGPNGSGKSTFLRACLGLIKPLLGEIRVLGTIPSHGHHHIGYMPQMRSHFAVAKLSSRAILEIASQGTDYGLPLLSSSKKSDIQSVLALVKAESYADRPFHQLSGGERQRIFLAQALLDEPKLLLLDEPLASLDPRYQETFISLLKNIQRELPVTILFTAHDPNPLIDVMSRVLYFAHGKAMIGTIQEVITSHALSDLYETAIEVVKFKERLFVLGEGHHVHDQEHHHV